MTVGQGDKLGWILILSVEMEAFAETLPGRTVAV